MSNQHHSRGCSYQRVGGSVFVEQQNNSTLDPVLIISTPSHSIATSVKNQKQSEEIFDGVFKKKNFSLFESYDFITDNLSNSPCLKNREISVDMSFLDQSSSLSIRRKSTGQQPSNFRNSLQIKNEASNFCETIKPPHQRQAAKLLRYSVQSRPPVVVPPILSHQQAIRGQETSFKQKTASTRHSYKIEEQEQNAVSIELTNIPKRNENFDATFCFDGRDQFFVSQKMIDHSNKKPNNTKKINPNDASRNKAQNYQKRQLYLAERAIERTSLSAAASPSLSSVSSTSSHAEKLIQNNLGWLGGFSRNENDSSLQNGPIWETPTPLIEITSKYQNRLSQAKKSARYSSLSKYTYDQQEDDYKENETVGMIPKNNQNLQKKQQFDLLRCSNRASTAQIPIPKGIKPSSNNKIDRDQLRKKLTRSIRYDDFALINQNVLHSTTSQVHGEYQRYYKQSLEPNEEENISPLNLILNH